MVENNKGALCTCTWDVNCNAISWSKMWGPFLLQLFSLSHFGVVEPHNMLTINESICPFFFSSLLFLKTLNFIFCVCLEL